MALLAREDSGAFEKRAPGPSIITKSSGALGKSKTAGVTSPRLSVFGDDRKKEGELVDEKTNLYSLCPRLLFSPHRLRGTISLMAEHFRASVSSPLPVGGGGAT